MPRLHHVHIHALVGLAIATGCGGNETPVGDPGLVVSAATPNATTTEAGGTSTFGVTLKSKPTAIVTVPIVSSDTSEGTVSITTLTFTPTNFAAPQMVTVTGADDSDSDGAVAYTVNIGPAASSQAGYNGLAAMVALTNTDNESAGITLSAAAGDVNENGGQTTFLVVLNTAPVGNVTLTLDSSDPGEGTLAPATLTFTPANFNAPQIVTVTGINDDSPDGLQTFTAGVAQIASSDPHYANMALPARISIDNIDNDTAGFIVGAPDQATAEDGTAAHMAFVLTTQPTADVTVNFASSDASEGVTATATLTFTSTNWNAPQVLTVNGQDDNIIDGNQPYNVVFSATTTADTSYAALVPAPIALTNLDDETAGFRISPISGDSREDGTPASFTIALQSQPSADVTFTIASTDVTEGTIPQTAITFTNANWNAPQAITVTGIDDNIADGNQPYHIQFGAATSTDADYAGLTPTAVAVTNIDDESAGFLVTTIDGTSSEAGDQASFSIALTSEPTADVTVHFASSNPAEGVTSLNELTFTVADYNAPQVVTITGVNDAVADGSQPYQIGFTATTSTDGNYAGLIPSAVALANIDDDSAGIFVSTAAGDTTESGGQTSFFIVLNSQPTADVTVHFASSDAGEGETLGDTVTFTTNNWNAPQFVTIIGRNDDLADGAQPYRIEFSSTTSADPNYAGALPASVLLSNIDNDSAGISVGAISGNTNEAGGTVQFEIVLNAQPTADVTLHFASDDATEGVALTSTATFTTSNWNAPQQVVVRGVDDNLADGLQPYRITFAASTSADADYAGVIPAPIDVANIDDDTAGITVQLLSNLTSETGGQGTFSIVLNSEPTSDVTVHFASDDITEATVSAAALFTPSNWNAPQNITVTGVNDAVADGNQPFNITFTASTSSDAAYNGIVPSNIALTNIDDDTPGFTVSAISGNPREDGTQASFTIVLTSEPTANVTVAFASDDPSEGVTTTTQVVFTPSNWAAPQTVAVAGQNDDVADGNQPFQIDFSPATSTDPGYAGRTPPSVDVTTLDDETAGFIVSNIDRNTNETGEQGEFTLRLTSEPTQAVTVHFSSNDVTEGATTATSLTFTSANWNAPQVVIVTGVNDNVADGDQPYAIDFTATTSSDANYAGLIPSSVAVVNVDNDTAGISVSVMSGDTHEDGTQATFAVVLNSEPLANVVVKFATDDATEGTTAANSITFTAANWNAVQFVTVTGQNDDVADGNQPYQIDFQATSSSDPRYAGLISASVNVVNIDDDSPGIGVSEADQNTTEAGGQATFSVVLQSQPTDAVTVHFATSDSSEGNPGVTSLTFTTANWNAPQLVTVTGVDDNLADGNQLFRIDFAATTSTDPGYAGLVPAGVLLSNTDDDSAGITVTPIDGDTAEDGTAAHFAVVLTSEPVADVTVHVGSNDVTEGSTTSTSATFTAANWNAPQIITVVGTNDNVADGNQGYAIVFAPTTSSDANYAGRVPANVAVLNIDNDSPGITISPISGDTTEFGTNVSFSVVLTSEPTANVTVHFASDDTTEGTTAVTQLVFTPLNWNAPQSVAVAGENDDVADGNQPYQIDFTATTSTDPGYAGRIPDSVQVVNLDEETAGIVVGGVTLFTTEGGAQGAFSVVLTSEPTAPVTVHFTSNDPTEGTTSVALVTFDNQNWNAPQLVTVTGQNDNVADGDQPYAVVFSATTSSDPNYAGRTPASVAFTNLDNDSAGINVSTISGFTSEDEDQATFTVVLASEPVADVVLHFASDDATEGSLTVNTLTFTAANWQAPQTVTVTGANENIADGNQPYQIDFTATTSSDARYAGLVPNSVNVTNLDNDSAGVFVSPIVGNTSEAGGQASFLIVLTSEPLANVTVHLASSDLTEGVTSTTALTFTRLNWNAPRTVTVTGVNDNIADGNQNYRIDFTANTSTDPLYASLAPPASGNLTNLDDDIAGITVTRGNATTSEPNVNSTFSAVLISEPTANVVLHFATNDATEGVSNVTALTFTPLNWNQVQTVTVLGQDDAVADGNQPYAIVFTATTSSDASYAGRIPNNVNYTNTDNDTAAISVQQVGAITSEAGGTASFNIKLTSMPTANVTLHFASDDLTEGTTNVTALTFTPGNFSVSQIVTVTGVNDILLDGDQPYQVDFTATTSSDALYAAITPASLNFTNQDDENDCPIPGNAQLAWTLNVPNTTTNWDFDFQVPYSVDNRTALASAPFNRIAYCVKINGNFVYTEMDDFTGHNTSLMGVPVDATFDQPVANLTVVSNVGGVANVSKASGGNMEFWPNCYATGAGGVYDSDDDTNEIDDCYGSFQVHRNGATLFGFNRWSEGAGTVDLGIGNQPVGHPDWTFANNANFAVQQIRGYIVNDPPAIACGSTTVEGASTTVTCPPGKTMTAINFASYGTPTGTCGAFAFGGCHAGSSMAVVQGLCLGQNSCNVTGHNDVFGDPCGGTSKHLAIQATCQ